MASCPGHRCLVQRAKRPSPIRRVSEGSGRARRSWVGREEERGDVLLGMDTSLLTLRRLGLDRVGGSEYKLFLLLPDRWMTVS